MTAPPGLPGAVRARFCPSPTGMLHVGLVRTALFNWAYARHPGGSLRLPDRGHRRRPRLRGVLPAPARRLRWLGLDWDEGPEVGGPHAPYRQSERPRSTARSPPSCSPPATPTSPSPPTRRSTPAGWRPGRTPSSATTTTTATSPTRRRRPSATRAARRCCGCGCPTRTSAWTDLVRGEVPFAAGWVPDFVLVRGNGAPLYPLVNPVDDALMGITHVLRGEDLLPSTPAADRAVRGADRHRPRRGHAAVRPPALRDGGGQPEAVQARPAGQLRRLPRARLPPRGHGQLPGAAGLVDRRGPGRLLAGASWSPPSTSPGSPPTRPAST